MGGYPKTPGTAVAVGEAIRAYDEKQRLPTQAAKHYDSACEILAEYFLGTERRADRRGPCPARTGRRRGMVQRCRQLPGRRPREGSRVMANSNKTCTVPGCVNKYLARGYCNAHWLRWRKYGDPLATGISLGPAVSFYRNVVLTDQRGPDDPCLIWPHLRNGYGYAIVRRRSLGKRKGYAVSRLICEDAYGPAPTSRHQAAHSCGKGHEGCVTKSHLRWATPKQNSDDRIVHGTSNRGERHGQAKLTESDVLEIRRLKDVASLSVIAARFSVDPTTIHKIHKHRRWSWL
jgi:hypothetical protein